MPALAVYGILPPCEGEPGTVGRHHRLEGVDVLHENPFASVRSDESGPVGRLDAPRVAQDDADNAFAVGSDGIRHGKLGMACDLAHGRRFHVEHEKLSAAVAVGHEIDAFAVGGNHRTRLLRLRRREAARRSAGRRCDPDGVVPFKDEPGSVRRNAGARPEEYSGEIARGKRRRAKRCKHQ